uniref:C-type lectin domain-containing protein n=1 Tax=Echeneis naucrates TaxID=173247 RepID=A0A665TT08_ECHNA
MLFRASVFLWVSAGFLSLPETSEACPSDDFPVPCHLVFRNVCFDFVEESKTWFKARSSCERRGGELLKVIMQFLSQTVIGDVSVSNCTFMKLNPLKFIKSDCNKRRGFLCTHRT